MRLMIASDLHGSAHFTRILLSRFEAEEADRLLVLGDLYYHGPRNPLPEEYAPLKVAAMLGGIKHRLTAVKGNCDSEADQALSEFPLNAAAAFYNGKLNVLALHGQALNEADPPAGYNCIAYGHLHQAFLRRRGDILFINPGSVSLPKDGRRGYVILNGTAVTLKDLDGNVLDEVII